MADQVSNASKASSTIKGAAERDMFVTLTRDSFYQAHDDARRYNESTSKRFNTFYSEQQDPEYLKANHLPKICPDMPYTKPVVAKHSAGPRHENTFVITNGEHSRQTNNGYKRGELGGFYCH